MVLTKTVVGAALAMLIVFGSGCAGCGGDPEPGNDAGQTGTDAGQRDAGASDAGAEDAGQTGATDAGETDAGELDGGEPDAGEVDAGATCASNADCSGATPVCDTTVAGGQCVGCLASTDCSGATPVCDTATNTCATCVANTDCSGATPICDTTIAGGQCVGCLASTDCSGATPVCDTATNTCATCVANADCSGATPVCDTSAAGGQCVACLMNADCSGATPVCNTTTNTCATCVADADCSGATPACDTSVAGGACVACTTDAHCAASETCDTTSNTCVLPDAETCATAQPLVFAAGQSSVSFQVDTNNATHEETGTCNNSASRDFVYKLTLTQAQDIIVTGNSPSGTVEPAFFIRAGDCSTGTQVACTDNLGFADAAIIAYNAPAGDYYIFVESDAPTVGVLDVTVALRTPVSAPSNDTCATAQVLTVSPGTPTTVQTDTGAATNDEIGTCNADTAGGDRDVVYEFTTTAAQDIVVTATPTNPTAADPVIFVRSGTCSGGTELACVDDGTSGEAETLTLYNQPAGTYFVVIETYNNASGPMDVTVALNAPTLPPANDTCAAPEALTFTNNEATFSALMVQAADDHSGTCNTSANSTEVVYAYTLTQAQDVQITATGTNADPVLYVQSGTCGSGTQLGCNDPTTTTSAITLYNQQPGTYYLFVEADGPDTGTLTGTVQLTAPTLPPANETCATAEPLVFTSNEAAFTTTTVVASDDEAGTCNTATNSPETVYSFTLSQAQDVQINATGAGDTEPVLFVRSGACETGTQLACVDPTTNTSSLVLYNLPAGTYFLFVESDATDPRGAISGTVRVLPPTPPPANDTCASPQVIGQLPATITGSTNNSGHDYDNTCGSTSGGDVVYEFTLAQTAQLLARVTPSANSPSFKPTLYVRTAADCASTTATGSVGCIQSAGQSIPAELAIDALPAGTYYLIVDGALSSTGNFTLEVAVNMIPASTNETCATAETLTLVNGSAVVYGTTSGAALDTSSSCDATDTANAPDLVYSFTTPALGANETALNAKVILNSLNANQLSPALSLRQNCAGTTSTDQLICTTSSFSPHQADDIELSVMPSTTYYVVVDGAAATTNQGPFRLEVNVQAVPAGNDVCAAGTALVSNTSVPGSTLGAANDYNDTFPNTWYTGGSCGGLTNAGPDVVYTYTATTSGSATATLQVQRGYDASLNVLSSCVEGACIANSESSSGDVQSVTWDVVAGTTYVLIVDGSSNTTDIGRGGFVISVTE